MPCIVKKLDPLLSSQIAAGEVIERPASVVKELVENSIDSGATRISVEVLDGGMKLVRVWDNGTGMSHEDAILSIERFATSKISTVNDLGNIETLGFRGEALPSIASCSKFTLETKTKDAQSGICVYVEGGKVLEAKDKGLPTGTTVTVRDLFFNIPARLKFVKSTSRERNAVIETVEHLALAWPHISFTLSSQGRVVLHTSGNGLEDALANIFGPKAVESMIKVAGEDEDTGITGFVGLPRLCRRRRDRQLFSVNRRPVRNPVLGWALDSAYAGLIPPKTYAVAFLEISVEPGQIDVNVHPTKAEIKFRNENKIRQFVTDSVKYALAGAGYLSESAHSGQPVRGPESGYGSPANRENAYRYPGPQIQWKNRQPLSFREKAESSAHSMCNLGLSLSNGTHEWEILGTLQNTYIVVKALDSLLIVDQHALAESLAYQCLSRGESSSQELLIPEITQLEPKEAALYEEHIDILEKVGFSTRTIGTRTILVTKVPLILGKSLPANSVKEILLSIYEAPESKVSPERALAKAQIATAACHASVKGKRPLTREEALALIHSLWDNPAARTCPHGRPTVFQVPYDEIRRFFGR